MSDDKDIEGLTRAQLKAEVRRLRDGIRDHRDPTGHDRCRLDDDVLYALLPEGAGKADLSLPPKSEFIAGCGMYHDLRAQGVSHDHCSLVAVFNGRQDAIDLLGLCRIALVGAPAPYPTNQGVMKLIADIERLRFNTRPTKITKERM